MQHLLQIQPITTGFLSQTVLKSRKVSRCDKCDRTRSQILANIAVSVSVSVSVPVSVIRVLFFYYKIIGLLRDFWKSKNRNTHPATDNVEIGSGWASRSDRLVAGWALKTLFIVFYCTALVFLTNFEARDNFNDYDKQTFSLFSEKDTGRQRGASPSGVSCVYHVEVSRSDLPLFSNPKIVVMRENTDSRSSAAQENSVDTDVINMVTARAEKRVIYQLLDFLEEADLLFIDDQLCQIQLLLEQNHDLHPTKQERHLLAVESIRELLDVAAYMNRPLSKDEKELLTKVA